MLAALGAAQGLARCGSSLTGGPWSCPRRVASTYLMEAPWEASQWRVCAKTRRRDATLSLAETLATELAQQTLSSQGLTSDLLTR